MDEWGRHPEVRAMRAIFGRLEEAQSALLASRGVDPFDPRLRVWRERALSRFERSRSSPAGRGAAMDGETAAALYVRCLSEEMLRSM